MTLNEIRSEVDDAGMTYEVDHRTQADALRVVPTCFKNVTVMASYLQAACRNETETMPVFPTSDRMANGKAG